MEPFYHPKNVPTPVANSPRNDLSAQSLPNNLPQTKADASKGSATAETTEKNEKDRQAEEPRTPHSRAKNLTRFYPVTKEASVVKPDVY